VTFDCSVVFCGVNSSFCLCFLPPLCGKHCEAMYDVTHKEIYCVFKPALPCGDFTVLGSECIRGTFLRTLVLRRTAYKISLILPNTSQTLSEFADPLA
jgi:hypothetical protein